MTEAVVQDEASCSCRPASTVKRASWLRLTSDGGHRASKGVFLMRRVAATEVTMIVGGRGMMMEEEENDGLLAGTGGFMAAETL